MVSSCACGKVAEVLVIKVKRDGVMAYCEECYASSDKSTTMRLNLTDKELEARAREVWGELREERDWILGLM